MRIHTIDLEFQGRPGLIAAFLIETTEGLVLVEPGPESTRGNLLRAMDLLGFAAESVRWVFITHAHLDHAGAGGWWARMGAELYLHPKAARHLIDPSQLVASARTIFGGAYDVLWGEMLPAPEEKVRVLQHGETASCGGVTVEAIETPGHAFHHHAYAIGEIVFSGDVAGARLGGTRYLSITSAPPQFHLESYLISIDRLAQRGPAKLYLTHFGEVLAVEEHLAHYRAQVIGAAELVRTLTESVDDAESIRIAYLAFQMERAFQAELPRELWNDYQLINSAEMCADGLRMFWERQRQSPEG